MQGLSEPMIRSIVEEVVTRIGQQVRPNIGCPSGQPHFILPTGNSRSFRGYNGLFSDPNDAIAASKIAFEELQHRTIAERGGIVDIIRRIVIDQSVELGTFEMNETKIGRLEHKIDKLAGLGKNAPGTEFLKSDIFSGDHGLTLIEYSPFGVIGAVSPVTHSLPTIANNAINMIASGNTVVVNPHPSGKRVAAEGVRRFNEAIFRNFGIDNLISVIVEPTMQTADVIFKHPDVALIIVTGGPGVAKAAMSQMKRAIVAGPGNPPVVVDETANLDRAAKSIISAGAYDNNLLCLAEKEVFVVDAVFEQMMRAMENAGAIRLNAAEVDAFTNKAITQVGEGNTKHDAPSRDFLGKNAKTLAAGIGKNISEKVELLYGETDESNPFVTVEQMMPFIPFVRVRDVDEAIRLAKIYEHGFRHTAIIHSNNVDTITRMAKTLDTTIFVTNGPSTAGNAGGAAGFSSFSIAGPTGEGITTPLTFTRSRRYAHIGSLNILGKFSK
ncbi:MAG: aldehyde dehydrogenase EutE [Planctomycetaceae bacterium]|nr:aldehyde dehydrogenase EutE [Planctomycetaceae bacterium]